MFSQSVCGPICQHPACWKAKHTPPRPVSPDFIANFKRPDPELPTLSVSQLEPDELKRHKALPPIRENTINQMYAKPMYSAVKVSEPPVPRVSHIIVQAGFQCYTQKRWIWLPSIHSEHHSVTETHPKAHIKDLTNDMLPSRPGTTRHPRVAQSRALNSRPRGHSYLDLVKKLGHLNLLDLPHYLQVKMLENVQLRRLLTTHPIDHIPAGIVPESALMDLMRYQMSPQLPTNPALEGVGIFFDPPDDLAVKQEPKALILPTRRSGGPEPSTYVPTARRRIEPSDLPLPEVRPAGRQDFREYIMSKRSSTMSPVIDLPQIEDLKSSTAGAATTERSASDRAEDSATQQGEEEEEEEEEEEDERTIEVTQSLDIVLPADEPGIRIPSAIEEGDDLELMAITGSLPPTRDSWRHTSFSTVTPVSASMPREKTQGAMTPPLETKTMTGSSCDVSVVEGLRSEAVSSPGLIPAPTSTPTNDLEQGGQEEQGAAAEGEQGGQEEQAAAEGEQGGPEIKQGGPEGSVIEEAAAPPPGSTETDPGSTEEIPGSTEEIMGSVGEDTDRSVPLETEPTPVVVEEDTVADSSEVPVTEAVAPVTESVAPGEEATSPTGEEATPPTSESAAETPAAGDPPTNEGSTSTAAAVGEPSPEVGPLADAS